MSSGDIAMRAEARRKKILQNAQERLDKVLSTTQLEEKPKPSSSEICQVRAAETVGHSDGFVWEKETLPNQKSITINSNSTTDLKNSESIINSTKLSDQFEPLLNEVHSKESIPHQPRFDSIPDDFSKHLQFLGDQTTISPVKGLKEKQSIDILYQMQYVLLAIVVRLLLYMQYGWLFGDMILVPFMLTVSIQVSLGHVHTSSFVQILGQIMAMCGISIELVQSFARTNSLVLYCLDNFSLYFVTFCSIHSFIEEEVVSR